MAKLERHGNVPRVGELVCYRPETYGWRLWARVENVQHLTGKGLCSKGGRLWVGRWHDLDGATQIADADMPHSVYINEVVPVRLVTE